MARHGKAGKNAVPPGNMPGSNLPGKEIVAPKEAVEEVAAEGKTQARGRSPKTHPQGPQSTEPHTPQVMRREVSRPMQAGVKKRGNRRDTQADPGMRGTGHNRTLRQGMTRATSGKTAIGGKRADNTRSRGSGGKK